MPRSAYQPDSTVKTISAMNIGSQPVRECLRFHQMMQNSTAMMKTRMSRSRPSRLNA